MNEYQPSSACKRLQSLGVSVAQGGRSFPPDAKNGKGHLTIQTGGFKEADLGQILPLLHELHETFELEFHGAVTDEDLRHLVGLRNILSLNLNHKEITDAGLKHLSDLTSLRVLELSRARMTATGAKYLSGLTNLFELRLWGAQVDDEGVEVLSGLTELNMLNLEGCSITDRALEPLTRLTELRTLDLGRTQIKGEGLALLSQLENLTRLDLNSLPINDRQASFLSRLAKLESLSLHETQVGDDGAKWLADLPRLCWLTLSNTRVGDDALENLRSCKELINIRLDGTRVTGTGLAHLPTSLQVLSLTEMELSAADITCITHLESLFSLALDKRIVDEKIVACLRRMNLGCRPTYDESVIGFSRLPECPLCHEVIDEGTPVFVARPFSLAPEFWSYIKQPIHWDCFARWEKRPRFAADYFRANAESMEGNQFWGLALRDEHLLVSVNPSQYVEEVDIMLSATGSSFRVPLADWEDWLEGEWFESCRHEVEREILAERIPSIREQFPTAEAMIQAAGFTPEIPPAQLEGMAGRISYEFAFDDLVRRAAEKGLACPHCEEFSNDFEPRKVEVVSYDGPRSMLVCKSCEKEFGPDDV